MHNIKRVPASLLPLVAAKNSKTHRAPNCEWLFGDARIDVAANINGVARKWKEIRRTNRCSCSRLACQMFAIATRDEADLWPHPDIVPVIVCLIWYVWLTQGFSSCFHNLLKLIFTFSLRSGSHNCRFEITIMGGTSVWSWRVCRWLTSAKSPSHSERWAGETTEVEAECAYRPCHYITYSSLLWRAPGTMNTANTNALSFFESNKIV